MNYYEMFLNLKERPTATHKLASLGILAIPILEDLFNGNAKNEYGISFNTFGVVLDCGYITSGLLGEIAKPLEQYIRQGIQNDNSYAIEAIGNFKKIEEDTVIALAEAVIRNPFSEAVYTIVKLNEQSNKKVLDLIQKNKKAMFGIKRAEKFIRNELRNEK